jgi:hypothetical protein
MSIDEAQRATWLRRILVRSLPRPQIGPTDGHRDRADSCVVVGGQNPNPPGGNPSGERLSGARVGRLGVSDAVRRSLSNHPLERPELPDRLGRVGPMRKLAVFVAVALTLFAGGCSGNASNTNTTPESSAGAASTRRLPPGPQPTAAPAAPAPRGTPAAPAPRGTPAAPAPRATGSAPSNAPSGPARTSSPSSAPATGSAPAAAGPARTANPGAPANQGAPANRTPANQAAPANQGFPVNEGAPVNQGDLPFSGTCEGMEQCPAANPGGAAGNPGEPAGNPGEPAGNPGQAFVPDFSGTCEGEESCPAG